MRRIAPALLAISLVAIGTRCSTPSVPPRGSSGPDATAADSSFGDVPAFANDTTEEPPPPCEPPCASNEFCYAAGGGKMPIAPDGSVGDAGDASVDAPVSDGAPGYPAFGCNLIPPECEPAPTCTCIQGHYPAIRWCPCLVDAWGEISVECVFP